MDHADFIDALGGGTVIADKLSIDREAVYAWKIRNSVPWRWRAPLLAIAKEKNVKPPKAFLPGVAA